MAIGLAHVTRSPRLSMTFDVVRRVETIGENGVSTVTTKTFKNVIGTVQPKSTELVREAEQQHMPKTLRVVTSFRLRGPAPGYQPDLIIWRGDSYVVDSIDDFSAYGAGHVAADCSSIDALDQPAS